MLAGRRGIARQPVVTTIHGQVTRPQPPPLAQAARHASIVAISRAHARSFGGIPVAPALAFPGGAAPEMIDHGRTGYLCHGEDEVTAAVAGVHQISRRHCRAAAERRFSLARMAADYDRLYRAILKQAGGRRPSGRDRHTVSTS